MSSDEVTTIEAFGSTSLVQDGSNYFLDATDGSAVELSYGGAPVVVGQFGGWAPIGAEKTTSGYEVALKLTGADQYIVWTVDDSGNYLSMPLAGVPGSSAALESLETSFQQDLNGDGTIGLPPPTVIEAFGSTSLVQDGSNYFLDATDGSVVELSYGGAPVVVGQFGGWAPIGAEKTTSGYDVALKLTGADQYIVWTVDDSGNYLSMPLAGVSGSSAALESLETSFQQDLNGDGTIGLPPPTVIEAFGSTSLVQDGSNYFLDATDGSAVELSYGGAPVVVGQFGGWAPIGAEKTTSGYEVALKLTGTIPGADQYTVWDLDNSGNYLSSALTNESGANAQLQSVETSFQQDLNGDGTIGISQITDPDDKPQFIYQGVDGNGVQLYEVKWNVLGSHPFAVRVLAPDHPSTDYPHSFLFALPVEAGLAQSGFGSGLDQLQQLGVQNQYDTTIVEPIFPIDPWYADNPNNPTIDFETFTGELLPAWVDSTLATTGTEKNLLIGFSKSGYGALDLLFKHPSAFDAAATWDFPANMMSYGDYGSSSSDDYGTDANFQDNYRLTGSFIDQWKSPFMTQDRIWISGYSQFQTDVADFDALLTSHGVSHTLATQIYEAHSWLGGWLSDAVAGLYGLEQDLIGSVPATTTSTSSSLAAVGSGNTSLGADLQQSTLIPPSDLLSGHA